MRETITRFIDRLWSAFLRPWAFVSKEFIQIRRQPQLILALIVAPFLVLLLFGLGYSSRVPELETVLVLPSETPVATSPESLEDEFVYPFVLTDITGNRGQAVSRLNNGEIDVIVALPNDAFETIRGGERATVEIIYDEQTPFQRTWLEFYSRMQTAELNRRVLEEVIRSSQQQAPGQTGELQSYASSMEENRQQLRTQIDNNNYEEALVTVGEMRQTTEQASDLTTRMARFMAGVALSLGSSRETSPEEVQQLQNSRDRLTQIDQNLTSLEQDLRGNPSSADLSGDLQSLEQNQRDFGQQVNRLPEFPAEVLVAPFEHEERNLAPTVPNFVTFYAPAVLALLIQHISVTLTALTLVRERVSGTFEVFQISPLNAREVLTGKYVSFFIQSTAFSAILILAMLLLLDIEIIGSYAFLALVVALLIAASLSVGFLISSVARTETQAVQLSMLVLLASVFFSGFFLPLETLRWFVKLVSYVLPVTYGIQGLQQMMLRGEVPPAWLLGALAGIAVGLVVLVTIITQTQFRRR